MTASEEEVGAVAPEAAAAALLQLRPPPAPFAVGGSAVDSAGDTGVSGAQFVPGIVTISANGSIGSAESTCNAWGISTADSC